MQLAAVDQLKGHATVEAWIRVAGHQVLDPLAGAGGLEHELSGDVVGQVERLNRAGQHELTGPEQVGVLLRVAGERVGHQLQSFGGLDQQRAAQPHVKAGGVDQRWIKGRHHAAVAAGGDLPVGEDHSIRSVYHCALRKSSVRLPLWSARQRYFIT